MEKFDPYRVWLGIPPNEQPPNHYRLLGVGLFESDPDVISNAADRQMVHLRSLRSGKHAAVCQRILNELSAARVCLLDARKKEQYDAQLRGRLAMQRPSPPPPPPTVAPPPPPAGNSGPPLAAVPPVQTAPEMFSGAPRSGSYTGRRKRSAWQGPAITMVLVGLTLVLLAWAFSGTGSERSGQSGHSGPAAPAAKHPGNGNGTSRRQPSQQPRRRPNQRRGRP